MKRKNEKFGSQFGIIAVSVGSAVGLGNLWGFPYKAGEAGGGSFVLAYIICVFLVGHIIMKAELLIGRSGNGSIMTAYKKVTKSKKYSWIGYMNLLSAFLIFSFYAVVSGWAVKYFIDSLNGFNITDAAQSELLFNSAKSGISPIFYSLAVIFLTGLVASFGIKRGLEGVSKILMPSLLILLVLIVLYNTTLDGFSQSVRYLFIPNIEEFLSLKTWVMALGQCFFSLSLGMGALLTYGNYIDEDYDLNSIANKVTFIDSFVAILAGVLIFPAVFTYGVEPSGGPGLIFVSLPPLFSQMPFGDIVGVGFFGLVIFAALTSCINLLEISVASFNDINKLPRVVNVVIVCLICSISSLFMSLSVSNPEVNLPFFGTLKNVGLFDQADMFTRFITLPLGGIMTAIIVGYVMKKEDVKIQLGDKSGSFIFMVRTISLALIVLLFIVCLFSLFINLGLV